MIDVEKNCFRLRASSQRHYIRENERFQLRQAYSYNSPSGSARWHRVCFVTQRQQHSPLQQSHLQPPPCTSVSRSSHNRIDTAAAAAADGVRDASPAVVPTAADIASRIFSLQLAAGAIKVTGRPTVNALRDYRAYAQAYMASGVANCTYGCPCTSSLHIYFYRLFHTSPQLLAGAAIFPTAVH